jgi:hypothetical protein
VNAGPSTPLKPLQASQTARADKPVAHGNAVNTTATFGTPTAATGSAGAGALQSESLASTPSVSSSGTAPVAPGAKQIRSAQLDLSTQNVHVNAVAEEIFGVVGSDHGTVLSSHITTATRGSGGGYASFSLSIPTGNLQDAMTQLSRLHYVAVVSSNNSSQNVSRQYNSDQRQLTDAQALRTSLLKQLAAATTDQEIDSIKAQLKLAEQQITSWQNTLGSLQHRISYSNLSVQVNQNGLPIIPVAKHHSSGFTISHAGHDAMRVLVVSAGVALITLAVMIPVGLVAALLMWLWVWLRQRRREHALTPPADQARLRSPDSYRLPRYDERGARRQIGPHRAAAARTRIRGSLGGGSRGDRRGIGLAALRRRRGRVPRGRRRRHLLHRALGPGPRGTPAFRRPLDHALALRAR